MTIRRVGAELFHTDGQTDGRTEITKLIVAFRNSANAPKNLFSCLLCLCLSHNFCNERLVFP